MSGFVTVSWANGNTYSATQANGLEGRIDTYGGVLEASLAGLTTTTNDHETRVSALELLVTKMPKGTISADAYTLGTADAGLLLETPANANAKTIYLPTFGSVALPTDTVIGLFNLGTGLITLNPTSTAHKSVGGVMTISQQYANVWMRKRAAADWVIWGDLG